MSNVFYSPYKKQLAVLAKARDRIQQAQEEIASLEKMGCLDDNT